MPNYKTRKNLGKPLEVAATGCYISVMLSTAMQTLLNPLPSPSAGLFFER